MRGRRYTAPPLTSTCSVVCQSYKETISKRKEIRKRKVDHGFHNPMGAFRRKADYKYEEKSSITFKKRNIVLSYRNADFEYECRYCRLWEKQ